MAALIIPLMQKLKGHFRLADKTGTPLRYILYPAFIAVIGLISQLTFADTLALKDGTTITGEIITIAEQEIVIRTIIGELSIARQKIAMVYGLDQPSQPSKISTREKEQFAQAISEANTLNIFGGQPQGVMTGLTIGHGLGVILAYDRMLSWKTQLHIQYDSKISTPLTRGETHIGAFTFAFSSNHTQKLLATYRYFPYTTDSFYLGTGAGISKSRFALDRIDSYDRTDPLNPISTTYNYAYHSTRHGAFIVGELGFQSTGSSENNMFYVHVGFQLAKFIYTSDSFDINDMVASPYANEITNLHEEQKNINQLVVGFGFYF